MSINAAAGALGGSVGSVLGATTMSAALVGLLLAAPAQSASADTEGRATPARQINYVQWTSTADLAEGRLAGVRASKGRIRFGAGGASRQAPAGRVMRNGTAYQIGHWTSRWTAPGFGLTELIPSWDATTPGSSFVEIEVRGKNADGTRSSWDRLARWAQGDEHVQRSSRGPQTDDLARVATDTWKSNATAGLTAWQLRVKLLRRSGTNAVPTLDTIGAMSSRLPQVSSVRTSRPGVARGITLRVPKLSQMTHRGHYPQYGNGGEAWCSPTSTAMVLGYHGKLPKPAKYSWVPTDHDNPVVDHAARMTYDYAYRGTGNWPFNTAFAATHVRNAFVTRFRSLREVERFIKAGIPVVTSVAFGPGELSGAPISSTNGHLMVVVGFTANGDVVVNDPAASSKAGVRRVYRRGQFENAWLPKSGGLGYVIRTAARTLPTRTLPHNW